MATPVVMPQMGESIAEGTIVRWIKKVGDTVDRDEPLFEISTDKVDAEIPSPAAGVLTAIQVKEGETVPVNSVVATIGTAGEEQGARGAQGAQGAQGAKTAEKADATGTPGATVAAPASPDTEDSPAPSPQPTGRGDSGGRSSAEALAKADHSEGPQLSASDLRQKSSPLVRKIAKEHNVDISQI